MNTETLHSTCRSDLDVLLRAARSRTATVKITRTGAQSAAAARRFGRGSAQHQACKAQIEPLYAELEAAKAAAEAAEVAP